MQPKPAFPFWTSKQSALYIELPSVGASSAVLRPGDLRKGPTGFTLTLERCSGRLCCRVLPLDASPNERERLLRLKSLVTPERSRLLLKLAQRSCGKQTTTNPSKHAAEEPSFSATCFRGNPERWHRPDFSTLRRRRSKACTENGH